MADLKETLETLTSTTEGLVSFVQMVADWIRTKKWVNLLCFLIAVIIAVWLKGGQRWLKAL